MHAIGFTGHTPSTATTSPKPWASAATWLPPRAIKARLLLFPNCYDQLHPPRASGAFEVAEHAPVAKVVSDEKPGIVQGTIFTPIV
jgi:hypothetical protein